MDVQGQGHTTVHVAKPIILGELRDSPSRHYNVTAGRGTCVDYGRREDHETGDQHTPITICHYIYLPQQKQKRHGNSAVPHPLDSTATASLLCPPRIATRLSTSKKCHQQLH
eukprot:scaffold4410_cov44-Attheya_sp.AAC.3